MDLISIIEAILIGLISGGGGVVWYKSRSDVTHTYTEIWSTTLAELRIENERKSKENATLVGKVDDYAAKINKQSGQIEEMQRSERVKDDRILELTQQVGKLMQRIETLEKLSSAHQAINDLEANDNQNNGNH